MPDFAQEDRFAARTAAGGGGGACIIGLDEAGRGPWAGPVIAAAVWLDPRRCPPPLLAEIDDSKRLSAAARCQVHAALLEVQQAGGAAIGIGDASVAEIDAHNILRASLLAMSRAAAALRRHAGLWPTGALIDGIHLPELPCPAVAIAGGDRSSLSIAAASIVAKVMRDRLMDDLARRHPGYGWERNRGYGTPAHRTALQRLGVSPEHRRSFRPIRDALDLTH